MKRCGWGGKEPCWHFVWTTWDCLLKSGRGESDCQCPVWASNGKKGCEEYLPYPAKPLWRAAEEGKIFPPSLPNLLTQEELEVLWGECKRAREEEEEEEE